MVDKAPAAMLADLPVAKALAVLPGQALAVKVQVVKPGRPAVAVA